MAAAELKLQVGLDLAFFRQQLAQLGNVAIGYHMPINIKFSPIAIQQELSRLKKNIGKTQYTININTNLEAEIRNADRLVKALQRVQRESASGRSGLPVDIRQLRKTKSQGGFSAADIKTLFNAAVEGGLLDEKTLGKTREQMVTAFASIGKDSIEGLLNGLSSADASIRAAAESIGATLITTTKASLGIRSPSKEFEEIGRNVGKGFEKGVLSSMDAAFNALERKMQQRMAVLDALARGIFHMLGMDPAAMMAADRQKRLPPAINWPSSIATPPTYQGRSGTMLAGVPPLKGIGGTAFGAQKYLPTALGNETKKVLRDAAHVFLDVIRQGIREVKIQDLGNQQRAIAGQRVAGLLAPGVGRIPSTYAMSGETQAELFARRTREAQVKSAFREMDVMGGGAGRTAASYNYAYRAARPTSAMVPYAAGGALVTGGGAPPSPPAPPTPPGGGRGGFGSFGGFGGAMPNVSLPGAGLVRELGDQFGYAAKQVLLFGAAYKALAFLTEFPAKVGEAVAQLQTFRNTLQSITPNADEFQKSNQFILDTVDKYNTPLQSARDGFTKLYASMAPAGFKGDDIRNIFAGISQGAATFGMSADKVDRVNYAFAQMASKGQVMSEELKGPLGDVLPGAVAIFAKAAGFEGPEAMVKFTKAMEDGRYKGEAMKQLLINVGIVMKDKFAAGAEGAAQTFQGQMNAMANATKKLYEAFVPAGNLFSSQIIAPFTSGLQVLAEGFNAFFSGVAAKTAGGFALSQELEKLRPAIKGIMDNITQLMPVLQSFATTLLGLGKILLQIAGNPFVGYLARVYLAVLPLTMAIQALNLQALIPMIASFVRAIPIFTAYRAATLQGASANKALQQSMVITGQSAGVTAGKIRLVGTALKSVFVGTLVGAVALGIGMIIEKMAALSSKMAEARANALQLGNSIRVMSKTELQVAQNKLGRQEVMLRNLQTQGKGQKYVPLNKQQENMLMELAPGAITRVTRNRTGLEPVTKFGAGMGMGMAAIDPAMVQSVQQKIITLRQNIQSARADLAATDQTATVLAPIPSASGASVSGGGAKPRAAARIPVEQILEREGARRETLKAAALDLALNKRILDAKKSGNEEEASSLEALRNVIKLRGRLAASVEFGNMLGRKEKDIVGKSLTKKQYDERRAKARQETSQADIDLSNAYIDLQKTEFANNDKILSQKQEYERTLEDIKIKNGEMTDEEIRRLEKLRQYQDILKANPSLTDLQKTDLFNAINAAPIDIIGEKLKTYRKNLDDMLNTKNQIVGIAESIGDSFGASFKGIIDGSMTAQQALASFFQNLSNYFADAVSKMIAEWLKIEAIKGLKSLLPNLFGGGAGFAFTGDSGLGAAAFGSG